MEIQQTLNIDPIDIKRRKKTPRYFLLSSEEAEKIERAFSVYSTVSKQYLFLEEDTLNQASTQKQIKKETLEAFKKEGIDAEEILRICDKTEDRIYWTYYLTDITVSEKDDVKSIWFYRVSTGSSGNFSSDDLPGIDKKSIPDIAKYLRIPEEALYVTSFEILAFPVLGFICAKKEKHKGLIDKNLDFIPVKSSNVADVLSNLTRKSFENRETIDIENFDGKIELYELKTKSGVSIRVNTEFYDDLARRSPSTDKLFTLLNYYSLKNGYKTKEFIVSLSDFMDVLDIKDRKEAVKKTRSAVDLLGALRVTCDSSNGSRGVMNVMQHIEFVAEKGRNGSYISGVWSDWYLDHLKKTPQQAKLLLSPFHLPDNWRNEYIFAKQFQLNKRRNAGKENENKLRVSTLLEHSTLPAYEQLKDKGQFAQRIVTPFMTALDHLEEKDILTYTILYSKSENREELVISDEDLEKMYKDYPFFSSLIIEASFIKEPDYENLKEHKAAQKEKATESKRKRGRPKKNS